MQDLAEMKPAELTTSGTIKDGKDNNKVRKSDRTTVYGTGSTEFMPKGKAFEVHPVLAKNLINSGKATAKQ